jgi:copper chaperone CopZ
MTTLMKLPAAFFLLTAALHAAEPVTRTFYVSGVECGSCVYMVQQSVTETKGVSDATVIQLIDAYANVAFDPTALTEHQVAAAVSGATPLHGKPYLATLKLTVTDFPKHAAKIQAAFAAWKDEVWLDVLDRAQGELEIHFHDFKTAPTKPGPRGWSLSQLDATLKALGASYTLAKEG